MVRFMYAFQGSLIFNIFALLMALIVIQAKINNNISDAKIYINKQLPISRLQSAGHRFSISSTDLNYELIGDVYESQEIDSQKQIYNISNYKKSESCTYYKSILQMNSIQGENLNYIASQSLFSQEERLLYIIGMTEEQEASGKFVKVYSFDNSSFEYRYQISFKQTKLANDLKKADILMTQIDQSLLFSDGNFLYRLDKKFLSTTQNANLIWSLVNGWTSTTDASNEQQFLSLKTVVFRDQKHLLFFYSKKVILYQYIQKQNTVKLVLQIRNQGQKQFEDISIGFNNQHIFILTGNQLLHYLPQNYHLPKKHQLAGDICTTIYIYVSTFHIICQYKQRNFIGEYFYDETANSLILNRFYNDIENYRFLKYIDNYLLIIGQNDIVFTSNGVNRKILLDMPKNAYSQKFVAFGIENIILLQKPQQQQGRTDFKKILFAIDQDSLVLLELKFVPSQVWCYIQKPPQSLQKNILIVKNTSQCQMNEKRQTLKSMCINLKPVQIFFQHYEIESKMTSMVVIISILLMAILGLFCLGCVFRQNMSYNHLLIEIKRKIKKLKKNNRHQLRQI